MTAVIQRHNHLDTKAMVVLVLCCAFWGFQQTLIKSTVAEVPPLWQASIRFAGATLCLLAWCRYRGIRLLEADGSLVMGLLAGLLFAAEFVFIYIGLQYTAASRLTVFLYTSPFWVAVFLPLWVPTETLRKVQWVGLGLAFAAVALAFGQGLANYQNGQWRGDLMGLAAGMFWGVTTLVLRSPRLATLRAEKTLFYQVATTTVVAPLLSWAWGEPWALQYSAHAWGSIALQTVVGAFGTYLIWMWLLRHYPATRMASFTFLSPVFALLFGVALLDEPLSPQLVTALSGVAVGIWLVNRRPS